ncbi:hypothetical protein D3C76_1067550 [compost metagenome]
MAQDSAAERGAGGVWRNGAVMSVAGSLCTGGAAGAEVDAVCVAGAGAGGIAVVGVLVRASAQSAASTELADKSNKAVVRSRIFMRFPDKT